MSLPSRLQAPRWRWFSRRLLGAAVAGVCLLLVRESAALDVSVPAGGDIQSAIAQVVAAGGGNVNLAAGTWTLTSSIRMSSNVSLNGQGLSTVIQGPKTVYGFALIQDDGTEPCVNMTVQNMLLDGRLPLSALTSDPNASNPYSGALGIYFDAYTSNHQNILIKNVEIKNTSMIHFKGIDGLTIDSCDFHHNGIAYWLHNLYLRRIYHATLTNTRSSHAWEGTGLHVVDTNEMLISKCEFVGNSSSGMNIQGPTANFTVQDCNASFNGGDGVALDGTNILATRNRADYNSLSGIHTFTGTGTVSNNSLLGNLVYSYNRHGNFTSASNITSLTPNSFEAERADGATGIPNTADWVTNAGFTGGGAVDFATNHLGNGTLTWPNISVLSGGTYPLVFRYANGSGSAQALQLKVNGLLVNGSLSFPATASATTWSNVTANVALQAGNNTVQVQVSGAGSPVLDSLQVTNSVPTVPSAPTALAAASVSPSQINLSWNVPSRAASYNIKRSRVSGGPYNPIATGVVGTSYSDTGILFGGTTYYYVVTAVNAGGESGASSAASATSQMAAPAGFSASPGNGEVTLKWNASAGAASYSVKRATVDGGSYTTIASVTATASPFTSNMTESYSDTTVSPGATYYYVISALGIPGESEDSYPVSVTLLPGRWLTRDVGAVGATGNASYSGSTFTVQGSGADIWSNADEFRYVYQTANGDCSITARVASMTNTHASAKAGVMIRASLDASSTFADTVVTPSSGVRLERRSTTGGSASAVASSSGLVPPYWVRVTRVGNNITGYRSANGTAWTAMGSTTIVMGADVSIGLAVTSHNDGTLCTALFDNVTASIGTAPGTPASLAGIVGNGQVDLTWNAPALATSYHVKRSLVNGGPYTTIATVTSSQYSDTSVANYTTYYYVVSASNGAGESPDSAQIMATPVGPPAAPATLSTTASPTRVSLTWSASTGATSYQVQRATSSGGPYAVVGTTTATSYVDTGLINGVTYFYTITALNPGGESDSSPEASEVPVAMSAYWDTSTAAGLGNGSGPWDTGATLIWSRTSVGNNNPLLSWSDDCDAYFMTGGTFTTTIGSGLTIYVNSINQSGNGTVATITGGTLQIDGSNGITNAVGGGNGNLSINSTVTLTTPEVAIDNQTATGTIFLNGPVTEAAGAGSHITKTGLGVLQLTVANSFTGGVTLQSASQITFRSNTSFGSGPITFSAGTSLASTASLYTSSTSGITGIANPLTITPGNFGAFKGDRTCNFGGSITGSGTFYIAPGTHASNITFSGDNRLFGGTVVYLDNGTTPLLLSSVNAGSANAIWTWTGGSSKGIGANVTGSNVFLLGELTSSGNAGRLFNNIASGTATFQIGDTTTSTSNFSGTITDGTAGGKVAVTKAGTNTQILSGTNTFTGPTAVNGGTLLINGSTAAGSVVTVNSGGILGGTGVVAGATTVASGGRLAPGSVGAGILTLGPLALSDGSIFDLDLSGAGSSDKISVTGSYTAPVGGTVTLNLAALAGFGAGTYPLITGAPGISAASFVLGSTPVGYDYALSASGGTLSLTVTAWSAVQLWRHQYFGTTANSGPAADYSDPEGDGVINLLEYAFGTDPLTASQAPIGVFSPDSQVLQITFPRLRAELTYLVEVSNDLIIWSTLATNPGTVGATVTVSDTATPSTNPRRFIRLQVIPPGN